MQALGWIDHTPSDGVYWRILVGPLSRLTGFRRLLRQNKARAGSRINGQIVQLRLADVNPLLTPKQVARAIDVSESSVKRWCDKGLIPTQYTAGGHRRILLHSLVEFLRGSRNQLVHPEAIGLPVTAGRTSRVVERACGQLTESLLAGQEARCLQIALDLYLAGHSMSVICDMGFAGAMHCVGDRWECGSAEVYQERRACKIAVRVLQELRSALPTPGDAAPVALGGAAVGDYYNVATNMVELVLRAQGWNATSLGDNLPFDSLTKALVDHRPRMFWLSCSHIPDLARFLAGYKALHDKSGADTAFVVGGRALTDEVRQEMRYSAFCDNMKHLEEFANTLTRSMAEASGSAGEGHPC